MVFYLHICRILLNALCRVSFHGHCTHRKLKRQKTMVYSLGIRKSTRVKCFEQTGIVSDTFSHCGSFLSKSLSYAHRPLLSRKNEIIHCCLSNAVRVIAVESLYTTKIFQRPSFSIFELVRGGITTISELRGIQRMP